MANERAVIHPPPPTLADDDSGGDDEAKTLEILIETARSPEGRAYLIATGTLPTVLRRITSSAPNLLIHRLRLLRNLCVGPGPGPGLAAADAFLDCGGTDRVASVLMRPPPISAEVVRAVLQVLGHVALSGGEVYRAAVWARFFPTWFWEIAKLRAPEVADSLCMVLDTCCNYEGGSRRVAELCEPGRGFPILLDVVVTADRVGHREEWLEWLLCKACIEEPHFLNIFPRFVLDDVIDAEYTYFSREQGFVLQLLSKVLNDRQRQDISTISSNFAIGMLKVFKRTTEIVDFTSRGKSIIPTGSFVVDILGISLRILRAICAWDNKSSPTEATPVESLLSAGLLQLSLKLLQELEPPEIIRESTNSAYGETIQPAVAAKVCPYVGFRSDIVGLIANCLFRRKQVQDEIRKQNAIPLLLQQCVIDEENPYLREWGMMSVRNLLDGNTENQFEVADLELKEPVITPQIAELGLKIEIDKKTRRPKLINVQ